MIDKLHLYRLAYVFQSEKPWEHVPDEAMYAVQHADGSISYCTFNGSEGNISLFVFTGTEELASFFRLHDLYEKDPDELQKDPFYMGEMLNTTKCLCCCYDDESMEMMLPEEHRSAVEYAQKLHVNIRPPQNHAHFISYAPGLHPWPVSAERELEILSNVLSAGIGLSHLLRSGARYMHPVFEEPTIPLFISENNALRGTTTVVPDVHFSYPTPRFTDASLQAKIRNLRKKEVWQCGIMYTTLFVGEPESTERPYNTIILLAISEKDHKRHLLYAGSSQESPETIVIRMAEYLIDENCCPRVLRCRETRSYRLLLDFCNRTGIRIERKGDTSLIVALEKEYADQMSQDAKRQKSGAFSFDDYDNDYDNDYDDGYANESDESYDFVFAEFSALSDSELRRLPRHIREALVVLIEHPKCPPGFKQRLLRLFPNG